MFHQDRHILTGLSTLEDQDRHFENALKRRLPVFTEGYEALRNWWIEKHGPNDLTPLLSEMKEMRLNSVWTSWS